MTSDIILDTDYEKMIIYPSGIDRKKMRRLLEMITELEIPLFYEQY